MNVYMLIGALVTTTAITLLLIGFFCRVWTYSVASVLIANALSAFIIVMLAYHGFDNLNMALDYLIPQALTLAITFLQWRGKRQVAH